MPGPEAGSSTDSRDLLVQAGLVLASDMEFPAILQRIVNLATAITGARYGAIGVIGEDGRLTEFVHSGMERDVVEQIARWPEGKGLLGALIADPRPLRLASLSDDPRAAGFPPGHPPMRSFLGTPMKARGRVLGNIYLTEKYGEPEFSAEDEESLVVLAAQAGAAIENARLYETSRRRERWFEALSEIATSIAAGCELDDALDLLARHARTLISADVAVVTVPATGQQGLVVAVADGGDFGSLDRSPFDPEDAITGAVMRSGRFLVLDDVSGDPRRSDPMVRHGGLGPAVVAPLVADGTAFGTLSVARRGGVPAFDFEEIRLFEAFVTQAALRIRYVQAQADLRRLAVLEERERIARDLHDGAIQSIFAVGMGLHGLASTISDERARERIESGVRDLDGVIRDLRSYIFELRPGILREHAVDRALQQLTGQFQERTGVLVVSEVDAVALERMAPLAGDLIQIAREILSNVERHAGAQTCRVTLVPRGEMVVLEIDDDGVGFIRGDEQLGQGLKNLAERAAAVGGLLEVISTVGQGTLVRALFPVP